jgi:hypothetical protein
LKHFVSCLGLLCLVFLSGCGLKFQEFSAPDGSYRVKLPGKATKTPTPEPTAEVYEVVAGNWNFGVVANHLPFPVVIGLDSTVQTKALEATMSQVTSNLHATSKNQSSISLQGFPGLEAELTIPAGVITPGTKAQPASSAVVRCYLVNSTLYVVMARCRSTITKDSPYVKTFFDSFVVNATSPAPSVSGAPANVAGMHGALPPASAGHMPMPGPGTALPNMTASSPPAAMHGTMPPPSLPMMSPATPQPMAGFPAGSSFPPGSSLGNNTAPGSATATASMHRAPPRPTGMFAGFGLPTPPGFPGGPMGPNARRRAPGINPNNSVPGSPGVAAATPVYTGTPVTATTKLTVGDRLQAFIDGDWVDVKVQKAGASGLVQVKVLDKQHTYTVLPRKMFQIAEGAEIASNDTTRKSASNLASATTESPPKAVRSASKPKSGSTPATGKSESGKGGGYISLDGATVDELFKIMNSKTEHRRVLAAEKLCERSDAGPNADVAQRLVDVMKVDELTVRAAAAKALEKWYSPEVNEAVVKHLNSGTVEVRQSMMKIMAANQIEGSADLIAKRLSDKDDRKAAVESLIAFGQPAEAAVISMLNHNDPKAKLAACDILKEIGSDDARKALKKATETWPPTERIGARKALQALDAKK